MNIVIREIVFGSAEYKAEVALRSRVLREPLGLQFSRAELDLESGQIHLGAFLRGDLVGCLLLAPVDGGAGGGRGGKIKMRQVAVDVSSQGFGVGRELVRAAELRAVADGFTSVELHVRVVAVGFYSKLGYAVLGDEFTEVGIPHVKMGKPLP